MNDKLLTQLKQLIKGDVLTDDKTLTEFSHDASLFEVKPKVVVFPKDEEDLSRLIKFVSENKENNPSLSITARSAGTDMSGGSINDSIIVDFTNYFDALPKINGNIGTVQPGVYYRDFEKETLKHDLIFPSYPASREICAMGGIVNNNSGGEKSLEYGKTDKYVRELKVVLADAKEYVLRKLDKRELEEKMNKKDFEGEIYRKIYKLINDNYDILQKAKPDVSKNSAGYYLWNVYDKEKETFDLTRLFTGAQGTLGLMTEAKLELVPTKKYSQMLIVFLNDLDRLGEIIREVARLDAESFETYDNNTLKLAVKFFYAFAKQLGTKGIIETGFNFLPEFLMILKGGLPKLILQIEFAGDDRKVLDEKISKLQEIVDSFGLQMRVAKNRKQEKKYWLIRRESFNLLRKRIRDKHTAPFIDDFVVKPEYLPEFLPKLNKILDRYPDLIYTIAGHMGDGNFHIIPLMNIEDEKQRKIIPELSKEVYDLVLEYKGSITAEHNDGLIRTPFLKQMYGEKIVSLFEETKKIFDPQNIFNPRKKVKGDLDFALNHIRKSWD